MALLTTLFTIFSWIYFNPVQALTDCDAEVDSCICVWNLKMDTLGALNGVYHKTNSATGTDRLWKNDDFTSDYCNSEPKYFAYSATSAYRWFLVSESNIGSGAVSDCYCDKDLLSDPLESTCPESLYTCANNDGRQYNVDGSDLQDLYIEFGHCPDVTDYCSVIKVTSNDATDCDGVYDAIPPVTGLDSQINMYQNQDSSATNKYIYFDSTQWRWVCQSAYTQCGPGLWPSQLIYRGGAFDAGTPDFTTIRNTGETWTVSTWGTLSAQSSSTATFECNPPLPTSAPVTSAPTLSTSHPSVSPTKDPSTSPTKDPSVSPTHNPTTTPTANPSVSPIGSPTDATATPSATPSITPTNNPSESPSDNPTATPSSSPTRTPDPTLTPSVNPTRNPSVSPSSNPTETPSTNPTPKPTMYPTATGQTLHPTVTPSSSPSAAPTANTEVPSLSPLSGGNTHSPVTATPTTAAPVPSPTRLTYPPSGSPVQATGAPTSETPQPTEDRGSDAVIAVPSVSTMLSLFMMYLAFICN